MLWGISGAISSGTFEALLYDELVARGAAAYFAKLLGYANSGAMVCNLLATLTAAPLYVLGGYPLVGWVSVGATAVHGCFAVLLPAAGRPVLLSAVLVRRWLPPLVHERDVRSI